MIARTYALETHAAFVRYLRMPGYIVPTIAFPLMFYAFFGLAMGHRGSTDQVAAATYLIGSYGTFGVIGAALFGIGVGIANDRAEGLLLVKRASPMPPLAYFVAKTATAAVFGLAIATALFTLGFLFGGVAIDPLVDLAVLGILGIGSCAFSAIGLAIGSLVSANAAPALVNCIYLPMSFASGLWIPIQGLPPFFQALAPVFPAYHLAQLALAPLGGGIGSPLEHVLVLAAWTVGGLGLAALGFRRDESRMHG
jgi:ABC-2 type transport system permease protein